MSNLRAWSRRSRCSRRPGRRPGRWLGRAWLLGGLMLTLVFQGAVVRAEGLATAEFSDGWRLSLPGWQYEFPRDHHTHPEFKTEWWYFTGNLQEKEGSREFGYQLTFFRQGVTPQLPPGTTSRWAVRDLSFAHFAVSDLTAQRFAHFSRWSRGAFGEAGFADGARVAWIRDWELRLGEAGEFFLEAEEAGVAIRLRLLSRKTPVFHGADGVSQKAEGPGRASHYYSFTRLETSGSIRLEDREFSVQGWSWYDHEWATNQLTEEQEGWDWFSLQFEDESELMVFQIRRRDGTKDPFSSGTFVTADGTAVPVRVDDFLLRVQETWRSPETGGEYPVAWEIEIPKLAWTMQVRARLRDQEFREPPIIYWEGAIEAEGMRDGQAVRGRGYLEMTGYAGAITGMQEPAPSGRGLPVE